MEIFRKKEIQNLEERFDTFPVIAIVGPRQCGKTTLAHQFMSGMTAQEVHIFDLENPLDLARLENPLLTLEPLRGYVIIDEIQRRPDLFPLLRVLVDKHENTRYLILGSASGNLLSQGSESLAGRISYLELGGFSVDHIQADELQRLWIQGGFPRSFLAKDDRSSIQWRQEFVTTFLERDIPALGMHISPQVLRRFWMMLAHYHGQLFNASEIAKSLAISDSTTKRYLDILVATFMVRQLQPWYYNTKKRIIKRPKIYIRDSGLFHALLGVASYNEITLHPKLGASWEGFAMEQVIQHFELRHDETYFWGLHSGGELDLIINRHGKLWGFEVKFDEAPKLTRSMRIAQEELSLKRLWVIYPGETNYSITEEISAVGLKNLKDFIF